MKNKWVIIIVIILLLYVQKKQDLPDHMEILDNFDLGLTNTITLLENADQVNVQNGYLELGGCTKRAGLPTEARVMTTKTFGTENLKFGYKVEFQTDDNSVCTSYSPEAYYGSTRLPLPFTCTPAQGGYHIITCTGQGVIEIRRSDDLNLSKWVAGDGAGHEVNGTNFIPQPLILKGGGLKIDYIKYEPYYSCEIDGATEVVVREHFNTGSTVSMGKLKYQATKFCPNDLAVLIVSNEGLTDEVGSITERLAKGEIMTVPANNLYWAVDYITNWVANMSERCDYLGKGEVYDTVQNKCVSKLRQAIPTSTLLYCDQTADCIIPTGCNDATVECINNQCQYNSTVCTPDQILNFIIVEMTRGVQSPEILLVGDGKITVRVNYPTTQQVAGKNLQIMDPSYLGGEGCTVDAFNYVNPATHPNCYSTEVKWGDFTVGIKNGETKIVNDYVSMKFIMGGTGVYNDNGTYDYKGLIQDIVKDVEITLTNVLDISVDSYPERITLNGNQKANLKITNNLFDLSNSGYKVEIKKHLRDISTSEVRDQVFTLGEKIYEYSLPSNELGVYTIKVTPYFTVLPSQEYFYKQLTMGYYVGETSYDCNNNTCTVGECQPDGSCLITNTNTVYVTCYTPGHECPGNSVCQSNGVCSNVVYIDCNTPNHPCPSGSICQPNGVCAKQCSSATDCSAGCSCNSANVCECPVDTGGTSSTTSFDLGKILPIFMLFMGFILIMSIARKR